MPLEHHRPVQGGKTYEITGHDKGTVTIEHPTTVTTHPKEALETRSEEDSLGGLF